MGIKHTQIFKSEFIGISEAPQNTGDAGFWLYDYTRGMNLSMRAKSEREAWFEALTYYQKRLKEVELHSYALEAKVMAFVNQFVETDE